MGRGDLLMLHVFICEDQPKHLAHLIEVVTEYILTAGRDIQLTLSTDNPTEILDYLSSNPDTTGLYILDVNLRHEMSGIDLASKIKGKNLNSMIVFVTTHSELAYLTFSQKVDAIDYIIKDAPKLVKERVIECLGKAYEQYIHNKTSNRKYYTVKSGGEFWSIPLDEILYFETHLSVRHRVILHTRNGQIEYRSLISEIAGKEPEFIRCNKSYVVNTMNVSCVDRANMVIVMTNGAKVPLTASRMKNLIEATTKTVRQQPTQ